MNRATASQVSKATRKGREELGAEAAQDFRQVARALVKDFVKRSREWFTESDGWTLDGVRKAGILERIRAEADALNATLAKLYGVAATEGRRAGYLHGMSSQRVATRYAREAAAPADMTDERFPEPDELLAPGLRRVARVIIQGGDGVWLIYPSADNAIAYLPGGGCEDGEPQSECAVREALEETGLLIELYGYICDVTDDTETVRYFTARNIGGKPTQLDHDGHEPVRVELVTAADAQAKLIGSDAYAVGCVSVGLAEAEPYFATCPRTPAGDTDAHPGACAPGGGFESGKKYHQRVAEISRLPPALLKRRDAFEVADVSDDVARGMNFSEPVEVSVFSDGVVKINDGHHRVAAAKRLGLSSIPVVVQAINAKGERLNELVDLSRRLVADANSTPS